MPRPPHPARPEIVALLRQELTHAEIAQRLGVGEPLVAKVARQEGIRRGQGRRRGDRREQVLALWLAGCALGEIALAFTPPISLRSVQNYVREAGLPVGDKKAS